VIPEAPQAVHRTQPLTARDGRRNQKIMSYSPEARFLPKCLLTWLEFSPGQAIFKTAQGIQASEAKWTAGWKFQ
jgi:hypothetical protein